MARTLSGTQVRWNLRDLRARTYRSGVWGLGYLGHSTFAALVQAELATVGFDILPERAALSAAVLTEADLGCEAGDDDRAILGRDVVAHFVAVPTERHDQPFDDAILDVFGRIVGAVVDGRAPRGTLIVVESTLAPGTTDTLLLPMVRQAGLVPDRDVLVALAPRRDWLMFEGDGLRKLDRVFGAIGPRSAVVARALLELMTETLHEARTHVEAELVKCVENTYRHVDITLANQLTLAFPQVDMVDVLRLAGTKWNMNTYHPSFGTGGYCIPLAGRYLLRGAEHPERLSLVSDALRTDDGMRVRVVDAVADGRPIVVLGLAYKGGVRVSTLSPTIAMAARMRQLGIEHTVYDPLYTPDEIERISGSRAPADLAAAVACAGTVMVVTDHDAFRAPDLVAMLCAARTGPLTVIDNYGVLEHVDWPEHVRYRRAGAPGWLGNPR